MRHYWASLALFLAVPAHAASLPEQSALTPDDQARLSALLDDHARTHPNGAGELIRQQQDLSRQLIAELYSPSPDLSLIERLDLHIRELRRQILRAQDETTAAFYRGLNTADRVKLMKLNYPLPAGE